MNNVGAVDRVIRVLLGIIILLFVFLPPKTPWAWIGLIPLITGLVGYCPLYSLFRINTNPKK